MTACVAFGLVRLPSTVWSPSVERLCWTASTSKPVTAAAPGSWSVAFQETETEVLSTERTMFAEPGCGAPASPGPAGQPPMPGPPGSPYPAVVRPCGAPAGGAGGADRWGAPSFTLRGDRQALTFAVAILDLPRHRALSEVGLGR